MNSELEQAEIRLKLFLKLLLFASLLTIFFHLFPHLTPAFLQRFATNSYAVLTCNSLLQGIVIILLLALCIGDLRRFSPVIRLFKWMLLIAVVWTAIRWIRGEKAPVGTQNLWQLLSYVIVLAALWILFRAAGKARYHLQYLSIQQFQTLQALAEVCITGDTTANKLQIEPIKVATNVDTYLVSFRATQKWVMKLVLTAMEVYPLLSLHPLLSLMQPAKRLDFLKKRFLSDVSFRLFRPGTSSWFRLQ